MKKTQHPYCKSEGRIDDGVRPRDANLDKRKARTPNTRTSAAQVPILPERRIQNTLLYAKQRLVYGGTVRTGTVRVNQPSSPEFSVPHLFILASKSQNRKMEHLKNSIVAALQGSADETVVQGLLTVLDQMQKDLDESREMLIAEQRKVVDARSERDRQLSVVKSLTEALSRHEEREKERWAEIEDLKNELGNLIRQQKETETNLTEELAETKSRLADEKHSKSMFRQQVRRLKILPQEETYRHTS